MADDIRNNIVIPLLRMVQKSKGFEIKRDDKLLQIGLTLDNDVDNLYFRKHSEGL